MSQFSYQYGVAGMNSVDEKEFFSLDDDAARGIVSKNSAKSISDIDLTLTQEKDVSKKSFHNVKRVFKRSPARSIMSAGAVTFVLCGAVFYSLGSSDPESKAGRNMIGLDTVQLDQSALGRDSLTQVQVDHIQSINEQKARAASSENGSYTPQFSDVLVSSASESETMTDDLAPTQVSFDGGVNVRGSSFVDANTLNQTPLAGAVNYGQAESSYGAKTSNYGAASGSKMPVPAAQKQANQPMEQGAGSPNATYQTDGSGGGTGGGTGGDGGMGAGGPNSTGIDPSIEALRQSLEDDYTQNQQYEQQQQVSQQQSSQQQQQAFQEQVQQRQQGAATALQQQQTTFAQTNNGNTFTASNYIPKQTSSSLPTWNNDLGGLANGKGAGASNEPPVEEEAKDLAKYIVRVGSTWQVVVENQVNTDNGTTVFARVLSGPYSGSRLIGSIKATGLGDRSAGVLFETLIPTRVNKNALPIQAVGMTLGDLNTHIATSVNRHYLQRYSALIAQGITGGYAEAYEDTSGSTSQVVNSDGTIVTVSSNEKPDSDEIRGQVIGQLGGELQGEFGKIRARPTTYIIAQGTPLTIMFTQNLNTKTAATSSISIGQGSSSSQYSNTSSYGMTPRNN